ncbi:unnamed protein product [Rotaria sp. Silwood2]|nr:unnamed protein product [Rotaria sp. Silwood2]CAF3128374.1 unnamed protein product [Rotaria sp. Silwood2]CAF3446278.1 unnamed protein product [Rotaria sp. Silwood2]CAF4404224.1 unnamed protein product [Rotaria sp. Silwood2]CAF4446845.1 unnamed protein product [Rotaria sp. Silwood2]
MFVILSFFVLALFLTYYKVKYFTIHGCVPGLSPHIFFGNLIQSGLLFYDQSPQKVFLSFRKRFGDTFQFWLGPTRVIAVNKIGDIQHIFTNRHIYDQGEIYIQLFSTLFSDGLICLRGAQYKRHASVTLPLFRRSKIIPHFDVIVDCIDKLLTNWRVYPSEHVHCDIVKQSENLMLAIFGWIAFDYDLDTFDHGNKNELTQALESYLSILEMVTYSPRIFNLIYMKLSHRHREVKNTIERYLCRMIDNELDQSEESRMQRKRTSLIASLVASLQKDEYIEGKKSEQERTGLSRNEVLHEMLLFLVAGFETGATSLAWFIHLLSKYPQVQQKIKVELMNNNVKRDLSIEKLDSLVYLDCVIKEVLRYSPPFTGTYRTLTNDDCLPMSGTQLFKGDQIFIPIYNLAVDTELWSIDPNQFYPERFLHQDRQHHPYAWIPFGSGHRQCIGQDLARFELKVVAARLIQYVTFGDGGPEKNADGHLASVTIKPRNVGVTITFD